jgi:RNA polymerase sigma-70 factor (ECF subfamily)
MLSFYLSLVETKEEKSKVEQLYYEYRSVMKERANLILHNEHLAEEAVHEAFVRIINNLHKIDDIYCHKTKAFVVVIVENVSLSIYKKEKKAEHIDFCEVEELIPYKKGDLENITATYAYSVIKEMPKIYKDVLMLKVHYDYTDKEIAKILSISHSTVRKRLQRARDILVNRMDECDAVN